jgi:hypothetical protein
MQHTLSSLASTSYRPTRASSSAAGTVAIGKARPSMAASAKGRHEPKRHERGRAPEPVVLPVCFCCGAACPRWRCRRHAQGVSDRSVQATGGLLQGHRQLADGDPKLGEGVLGGGGVAARGGVEHLGLTLHGPGRLRRHLGVLQQPPGKLKGPQPVALTDERGAMEGHARSRFHLVGRLPARVAARAVAGFGVGEPLEGSNDRHARQHPSRDGRSTLV